MNETFRILVTNKTLTKNYGKLRNIDVLFINDKDFYEEVKNGTLDVKNKVILCVEKSYSLLKKLIDNDFIKLDVRGLDKQKFMKLDYCTSLIDNSKYIILDSMNEVDKNKKITLFLQLDYNSENNNSIIPYKIINKKYFVDNYDSIIESLVGDIGFDYETHGIDMMNVDSKFEIIGVGFCSDSIGYYLEFRNDNSIDEDLFKKTYKKFIKENNKRLWAYYCPFEIMVNYWYLEEFIEIQDSMVLCISDENSGSLKYASQYYLKSVDWESETNSVKEMYIRDIYETLSEDDKHKIHNILGDVSKKNLEVLLKKEKEDFIPTAFGFDNGEYESYKEKYFNSNGSTISYLPSKIVSKYCIYDCYNTLRLKNMLYDKYSKAYDCFIKNIYLSIPLQNHGLLLDKNNLDKISNKYENILYNLEVLISKFYYTYNINSVSIDTKSLMSEDALTFFKNYGIESTLNISKNIINDCINKDIIGYLDYTSLYEKITNESLRNKIISLLDSYKSNESLLKSVTASSSIVKEINHIINNYEDDSIVKDTILNYFKLFTKNFDSIKPSTKIEFIEDYNKIEFNFNLYNNHITSKSKEIIKSLLPQLEKVILGKDLSKVIKSIIDNIKVVLKEYRESTDNIINKIDRSIKKKTIKNSKNEFINILENYFTYELVVKYKIGDNFYNKNTRERSFKLLTFLELNDYISVNSCNNQQELDDLDDITEDLKFKYGKIKFSQSFLNEFHNIYEKSTLFYNENIVSLLDKYYKIEDIIDNLIENKLLDKSLLEKALSKDFNFIDYKKSQFDLDKLIEYYINKDKLDLLNSIENHNIFDDFTGIKYDTGINLVTPINKTIINNYIMNNYKNLIYNFHKIYNNGKFDISKYSNYDDMLTFLESKPESSDSEVITYVKKSFSLLPQMRTLKYQFDNNQLEEIDISFENNKSFDECAKIMYCVNLFYKIDKVYTAYIHGNVIAKNTKSFNSVDDKMFTRTMLDSKYKITQPSFKMLSLKTKRSSSGIHTLNKHLEPSKYLKVYKDHIGIYFDLSAAEVRAAAYMSGDETMIKLFNDGIDIYNWMRESITELIDRNGFKGIVLGLIYGRSSDSIAKALSHLNPEIVLDGINMFKNKFNKLWTFIESQTKYCIDNGKINTVLGDLIDVSTYHNSKRSTVGMNYSVQGFTAALVAEGGYNVYKSLYDQNIYIRVINLVHDSLSYSSHSKDFFIVYNKLQDLFINYLYNKYGYLFKFDLDLFLTMSDKTSIKKIDDSTYELSGDSSIEIFDKLNNFNNLELINKEVLNTSKHIYQVIDNDRYIKTPQNLYIENNFNTYNKSKVIFKFLH